MIDEVDPVDEQTKIFCHTEVGQGEVPVVDRMTRPVEPSDRVDVVEADDVVTVGWTGQQDTRFLETLAECGHQPRKSTACDAQASGGSRIVQAVADRIEHITVVGGIDLAAGKHVLTTGERRRHRALQHEHLEPVGTVAQQHHGRGRSDRHGGGRY